MKALVDQYTVEELKEIVKESTSMKDVIKKLGYGTANGSNHKTVMARIEKYNIDISHFCPTSISASNRIQRTPDNTFIKDSSANQTVLRRMYLKQKNIPYVCTICGQEPYWNNKELTLILDHINGHNTDDRLENLRWVCPNCNQQLDTTAGKNKKNY